MTLAPSIDHWPTKWREAYHERAAIMEFDGRMSRADAEREAEKSTRHDNEARPRQ